MNKLTRSPPSPRPALSPSGGPRRRSGQAAPLCRHLPTTRAKCAGFIKYVAKLQSASARLWDKKNYSACVVFTIDFRFAGFAPNRHQAPPLDTACWATGPRPSGPPPFSASRFATAVSWRRICSSCVVCHRPAQLWVFQRIRRRMSQIKSFICLNSKN